MGVPRQSKLKEGIQNILFDYQKYTLIYLNSTHWLNRFFDFCLYIELGFLS